MSQEYHFCGGAHFCCDQSTTNTLTTQATTTEVGIPEQAFPTSGPLSKVINGLLCESNFFRLFTMTLSLQGKTTETLPHHVKVT